MARANLVIGQSGGPTVVINQSLAGVVEEAKKHAAIKGIYGALNGVMGIMEENFVDLRKQKSETMARVAETPASALGSCRHKPKPEDCEKIFSVFRKYDVRYFFYVGGNDSAETADIISRISRDRGYELKVFHVPKTIDNDLEVTDHCPGYGSAARYVALCFLGNDLDNRSLPGVKIDIVMGRHAGWLTAAAALAKGAPEEGPHLLYFPERPVTLDRLCVDIDAVYRKHGRALVAMAEGTRGPDGKVLLESNIKEKDAFGNIQLSGSGALGDFLTGVVKEKLGPKLRVRSDTLGYAQRSYPTVVSTVDAHEARMVGRAAVKFALAGKDPDGSVIIRRTGTKKRYESEAGLAPLASVARVTKRLPEDFINAEGNGVTARFVDYALPLVGKLPKTGYLKKILVPRISG